MRRLRFLWSGGAGLLLAASAWGQTSYYVNPNVSTNGDGSLTTPFKTIGAALSASSSGPLTIHLMRGDYSAATNGEQFPLVITQPNVAFEPVDPAGNALACGPRFVFQPPSTVSPFANVIDFAPPTTVPTIDTSLTLRGIEIQSTRGGIRYTSGGVPAFLTLEDVVLATRRGVQMNLDTVEYSLVTIRRNDFDCLEACLSFVLNETELTAEVLESSFTADDEAAAVIDVDATGESTSVLLRQQNSVCRKGRFGVRSTVNDGASIATFHEHCVFHDLGRTAAGGIASGGGIVDAGGTGSIGHTVIDTIFFGNDGQLDMPGYSATTDVVLGSIVEQANLIGVNGNFTVTDPMWVDAAGGDYHLMPGSPAIDTGSFQATSAAIDFDGDPRIDPIALGGAGVRDVGLDEFFPEYVYLFPRRAKLGATTAVRLLGPPNAYYAWLLGVADANGDLVDGGLGPSLHLKNPLLELTVYGVMGNDGFAESALTIPNTPALAGTLLAEQALFGTSATSFVWGVNGFVHPICR